MFDQTSSFLKIPSTCVSAALRRVTLGQDVFLPASPLASGLIWVLFYLGSLAAALRFSFSSPWFAVSNTMWSNRLFSTALPATLVSDSRPVFWALSPSGSLLLLLLKSYNYLYWKYKWLFTEKRKQCRQIEYTVRLLYLSLPLRCPPSVFVLQSLIVT